MPNSAVLLEDVVSALKHCEPSKTAIMGIGNPLRGDDSAGHILARRLKDKIKALVVDCEAVPENATRWIVNARPKTVIFIDAADWKGKPGDIKIIAENEIQDTSFSTHNSSLKLVMDYLRKEISAEIIIIGIQRENLDFLVKPCPKVKTAVKNLEKILLDIFA